MIRRDAALGVVLAFSLVLSCGGSASDDLFEGDGGKAGSAAGGGKGGSSGSGVGGAGGSGGDAGSGGKGAGGSGGSGGGGGAGISGSAGFDAGHAGADASTGGSSSGGGPTDATSDNDPNACPPTQPANGAPCDVIFVNNTDCHYGSAICVCTITTWFCV